ncbi:hypothetical protein K8T06_08510 [bacterium]|nr:hypothetical protein [bacterium]
MKARDDLDGGDDDHRGVRSLTHGDPPEICMFDNFQAEVAFLLEHLLRERALLYVAATRAKQRVGGQLFR